ncbi:MAG: hydroxyisourate hydrolase [Hyphomicrobiaceae bacterium]
MPGISVHVVDTTRGLPAAGMRIEIYALAPARTLIAEGLLAASGALDHAVARQRLAPGSYEVDFHAGDFFTAAGVAQAAPPFLDVVPFRFQISDPEQHYHLPMKMTPWGFSVYRGS